MRHYLMSFLIGVLFGLGLVISMMVNPQKVLNFLDLAGTFDPSLILVMASALGVTFIGYRLLFQCRKPLWADQFSLPAGEIVDARLIGGSALFGIGWGMTGFCPGPAIAAIAVGNEKVFYFLVSMLVGMAVARWLGRSAGRRAPE